MTKADYYDITESRDEAFVIDNDELADWAINKIKEEREECDRLLGIGQKKIDELTEQMKAVKEKYANKAAYLESLLSKYFDTVPHKKTETQESYQLFSGSLVLKNPYVSIKAPDEKSTEFIEYVRTHAPEYIRTTETVSWGEYKKTLKLSDDVIVDENGEIVEGLVCEETPAKFIVK